MYGQQAYNKEKDIGHEQSKDGSDNIELNNGGGLNLID